MDTGYLNERSRRIVGLLENRSNSITIKELAEECSVSTRTIYKEVDKISDWLKGKNLSPLTVLRGKVQPFTEEEKNSLETIFSQSEPQNDYVFTPSERTLIIVCQIIASEKPVYVEDLVETLDVSRNTIFTDLQACTTQLQTYQLRIGYEKKEGYYIEGDPVRIRAVFFLLFNKLEPLISSGKLSFLRMDRIAPYLARIEEMERELHVDYVKNDVLALSAMLPIMEKENAPLNFTDLSLDKIRAHREYEVVGRHFPELREEEKIYLTLHLLGGRQTSYKEMEEGSQSDEELYEMAKNLVAEFERCGCVVFDKKDQLIENVRMHLEASVYRYKYGIQIGNPMAEDIKREYPYIFDVMRQSVRYLENKMGVALSDNEVSYLALHFGSHLEYATKEESELRILVVCLSGMATGNMIARELRRILPQATIVGVRAASSVVNAQQICDLIVSSVKITSVVPVILVNPILNDFDRKNIFEHPLIREKFGFVDVAALYQALKSYVAPKDQKAFRAELERFFYRKKEADAPALNPNFFRMSDLLSEEKVVFLTGNGAKPESEDAVYRGWTGAIHESAAPLIQCGSIEESYPEKIIERIVEAGPYMFVTKDVVLGHASPTDGVNRLDISMGVAPDGILFDNGKRARIILCLAVEDQVKHMEIIRDIRKALAKPSQIDELVQAESAEEICEIIRARLENEG